MKQNCKQTFIHKNNYYLATQKGGKFKVLRPRRGVRGGSTILGGGGLALDYPSAIIRKNQIKKKGRKFENSINSKNNQVLNSNYCCCKYSTFSIKKSKYSRVLNSRNCMAVNILHFR